MVVFEWFVILASLELHSLCSELLSFLSVFSSPHLHAKDLNPAF